ncbi:MAG: CotH kinase family protein, partial [Myxococcota bacterium]|nr:CotH kinase family protein [Myxococcota bacterium]
IAPCLASQQFLDAGQPAPRCGFVSLNVENPDGAAISGMTGILFAHMEAIDARFMARHDLTPTHNALFRGRFADLAPDHLDGFDQPQLVSYSDGQQAPVMDTSVLVFASEHIEGAADHILIAHREAAIRGVVNVASLESMWALETLMGHWNGYTGNANDYWVGQVATDERLRFIPGTFDGAFMIPLEAPCQLGRISNLVSVERVTALIEAMVAEPEADEDAPPEVSQAPWDESAMLEDALAMGDVLTAAGFGTATSHDMDAIERFLDAPEAPEEDPPVGTCASLDAGAQHCWHKPLGEIGITFEIGAEASTPPADEPADKAADEAVDGGPHRPDAAGSDASGDGSGDASTGDIDVGPEPEPPEPEAPMTCSNYDRGTFQWSGAGDPSDEVTTRWEGGHSWLTFEAAWADDALPMALHPAGAVANGNAWPLREAAASPSGATLQVELRLPETLLPMDGQTPADATDTVTPDPSVIVYVQRADGTRVVWAWGDEVSLVLQPGEATDCPPRTGTLVVKLSAAAPGG